MSSQAIGNVTVVASSSCLPCHTVVWDDGVICEVCPDDAFHGKSIDGYGLYLVPGYIDLHIHGAGGFLAEQGAPDLAGLCALLPRYGVTGFLPALTPTADDSALLRTLACEISGHPAGASVFGIFLEGHYLRLSGAIPELCGGNARERLTALRGSAGGIPLVFGVSPENEDALPLMPELTADGFPVFITHTCANAAQTERLIRAGARHATHFYDVFPYPGDMEPGVRGCGAVEAVMADPGCSVDFILDGVHVEPVAVKMAIACKGIDAVSLITDSNVNAGLPPGRYTGLGGVDVVVGDVGGPARMGPDSKQPGSLAGSGLTMDQAVRNAVLMLGLPLWDAVRMASGSPARVLGFEKRKGEIAPGYDADFSLLRPDLTVSRCYVGGVGAYAAHGK